MRALLAPYAWKHMGPGVPQAGDPVAREVFHVRPARPFAVLLMGPRFGQVHGGLQAFSRGAPHQRRRALGAGPGLGGRGAELHAVATSQSDWLRLDKLTRQIFEGALWRDYAALAVRGAGGRDLVFDGHIPADSHERFAQAFADMGYVPLPLKTPAPPHELSRRARVESRKYQLFLSACAAVRGRRR